MIFNLEEYEPFICEILKKMPLLRTKQLIRALIKTYKNMDSDLALEILLAIQRRGHILLSPDGWAMNRGAYQRLSGDRFNEQIMTDQLYRLNNMDELIKKAGINLDTIDCFSLVVDMLPVSSDFIVNSLPWLMLFDTPSRQDGPSKLYQITKIPAEREDARCEMLRCLPKVDDNMKQTLVRLAVIENEAHAWMVPHLGFRFIVVMDDTAKEGFRIVEQRTGSDIWSDQ